MALIAAVATGLEMGELRVPTGYSMHSKTDAPLPVRRNAGHLKSSRPVYSASKEAGRQSPPRLYLVVGIGTIPLRGPNNRTPIPIRSA